MLLMLYERSLMRGIDRWISKGGFGLKKWIV